MAVAVTFNKRVPQGRATLSELMARQKAAVAGQASSQGIETPTIMQGLGKLGMIGADVFKERRAARDEASGRADLAKIMTGIGAEGATPEQEAAAYLIDPEMAQRLREERLSYAQQLAERQQAVADREDTQSHALGLQNDQQAAAEGLQTGRQTFEGGQNDLQRGVTVSEGQAGRDVQTSEGQANRDAAMAEQLAAQTFQENEAKRKEGLPESPSAVIIKDWYSGNYQGREQDFIADLKKAQAVAGPATVINTGDQPKTWEEFDKTIGKNFAGYLSDAASAGDQLRGLEILDQIDPAAQGPLEGRLAEMFPGVSSQAALFESIVKRMAPKERVEGSGSQSDLEYKGLLASWPQLKNMPGANKAIAEAIRAQAKIAQERAAIVVEMSSKRGDEAAMLAGYNKLFALDQRSILTPELKDAMLALQGNQPTPQPGSDEEELRALVRKALGS